MNIWYYLLANAAVLVFAIIVFFILVNRKNYRMKIQAENYTNIRNNLSQRKGDVEKPVMVEDDEEDENNDSNPLLRIILSLIPVIIAIVIGMNMLDTISSYQSQINNTYYATESVQTAVGNILNITPLIVTVGIVAATIGIIISGLKGGAR